MRVTVCELPDERAAFATAWEELVHYVREQRSDIVVLPEFPFSAWFARTPHFDEQVWQRVLHEHDVMMERLSELAPALVLATWPVFEDGRHLNRAFLWTAGEGYRGVHDKYYFPNEEDFYERNWFDRSPRDFSLAHVRDVSLGFLLCTEVMFNEWARYYGRQGAQLIAVPRASVVHERWEVAIRMAAIVSGSFVLSSNRVDEHLFGGKGYIVNPDGIVLAATSRQQPFVSADIDLAESERAKKTYPRDVLE